MSFLKIIGEHIEKLDEMVDEAEKMLSGEEIEETDEGYTIKVNLPNVKKEDVEVYAEKGILKVRVPVESVPYFFPFFPPHIGNLRNIPLPVGADAGTATAKFDAGVLTVAFKKTKSAKRHKVVVK